uniref:Uncharacterized protein n=1 Tax=Oryza sativa subsp. japonica TaxID=39947 RepID=Q6Z6F1_ORYSJ|nr:hypothetical protein [Oryza sativa Japonica Group]BAD15995.1 hypothetical protein [Oryza sativa Japonica Group]
MMRQQDVEWVALEARQWNMDMEMRRTSWRLKGNVRPVARRGGDGEGGCWYNGVYVLMVGGWLWSLEQQNIRVADM